MYTYENARRKPKTAKKSRAAKPAKPAKTLTEKQHNAHARSRAAFQRARQIWSAVPGCDPYSALRQAWEEVKRGSIAPNYTKTVKPPKPKKPKKNPQEMIKVVVVDINRGELVRFKLPGNQHALMRDLEPGFDDETARLWGELRARGVNGKVKMVTSDWPTGTLTFTVVNSSYYPPARNPSFSPLKLNLLTQAAHQDTVGAYKDYEKNAAKELEQAGLVVIVDRKPKYIRIAITEQGRKALDLNVPPETRRFSLAEQFDREYEQRLRPAGVLRSSRR
jgi:hypothetical protein